MTYFVTMGDKSVTLFVGALIYSLKTIVCDVRLPVCFCNLSIDCALGNGFGITSDIKTV
jgi:hypothetical protein